jgi:hypothetical protein
VFAKLSSFLKYSETYQILVGFIDMSIILRFLRKELETKVAGFAAGVATIATTVG